MVRLLFIVNLPFILDLLYLPLTICLFLIVLCSFRAVFTALWHCPKDTINAVRAPDEVRVAESRKHPSALDYISYSCGALPLLRVNHGPCRQRSWPVNIHYVMFSHVMFSHVMFSHVVFSHVRFRVGRDAAPGTDRMVYKRSAGHRPDNKRQKE